MVAENDVQVIRRALQRFKKVQREEAIPEPRTLLRPLGRI